MMRLFWTEDGNEAQRHRKHNTPRSPEEAFLLCSSNEVLNVYDSHHAKGEARIMSYVQSSVLEEFKQHARIARKRACHGAKARLVISAVGLIDCVSWSTRYVRREIFHERHHTSIVIPRPVRWQAMFSSGKHEPGCRSPR